MARLVVCLLLVAVSLAQGSHEKYEGHQLFRVAGPKEEIAYLESRLDLLSATPAARTASGQLEALVRLSPEDKQQWIQYFELKNMAYTQVADNLASILRDEENKIKSAKTAAKRSGRSISWDTYYNHEEINDYLDELAAKYPSVVTVVNAALSYEGRQIKYVRISTSRFEDLRKPVIIIDAAMHAREWLSPPVALYIIEKLIVDIADRDLTEKLDWIIIPVANPDGYEYSINEDRMWRKTRSLNHPGSLDCRGVNINRNFDYYWGTLEASSDPCSNVYEGPSSFSEAETRVVRDVVMQQLNRTALYISLQSYGSTILYPWGNKDYLPSNGLNLHVTGTRMARAIYDLSLDKDVGYIVGNTATVYYYITGTSQDWIRTAGGVPLTYTFELPGLDYGFLVPPEHIKQIVTETWGGIFEGARHVISLYN